MTVYNHVNLTSVVDISGWNFLDESLAGSRAKQSTADPASDNLYIFKEPKPHREAQIWSELIASYICGDLLDWPVQHAQIAIKDGRIGNLLRYVFTPGTHLFVPGEQLCKHYDPEFDPEVGRRHTWDLIRTIHDDFVANGSNGEFRKFVSAEFKQFWARTIAFDTLISNTDRHAENWAFTFLEEGQERSEENEIGLMAPFYDNASSMGCEVEELGLSKWFSEKGEIIGSKVERYCNRGCHHLSDGSNRYKFEELALRALHEIEIAKDEYEQIAELNLSQLDQMFDDIMLLPDIPPAAKMTERRREQIVRLLHEGQARVIRCLEDAE